jgi:hypothetical protein
MMNFITCILLLLSLVSQLSLGLGLLHKIWLNFLEGLYSSPNMFRVIKSRRMRWAGHVLRMGEA